jgi:MEMO1 family protein
MNPRHNGPAARDQRAENDEQQPCKVQNKSRCRPRRIQLWIHLFRLSLGYSEEVANTLARLRMDLDFMPSPVEDRPGLLIRDPYHYSDATLIVPAPLVACLEFFDGQQSDLDLKQALVQITGELDVHELQEHLTSTLSSAGFLHDDAYEQLRDTRCGDFARAPERAAAHAGSAYPDEVSELRATLRNYMGEQRPAASDGLVAIAAPHVSPFGGWECYQAAYNLLTPEYSDRIFVVLGTSHYGEPDRFGLTRKPFVTPFGTARTETGLVDEIERRGGDAVKMEDYCHAVEHSIEFQVIFLQHVLGPDVRILPMLCGPFANSIYRGGLPEDNPRVAQVFDTLGDIAAREGKRLMFVLGIDMAHMGRRYGDRFPALANVDEMAEVEARDRRRIDHINGGDAGSFWGEVQRNHDDLKWCGSSPLYTFMKAAPGARGELRQYQQWNIDEQSVVSFAAMSFR